MLIHSEAVLSLGGLDLLGDSICKEASKECLVVDDPNLPVSDPLVGECIDCDINCDV